MKKRLLNINYLLLLILTSFLFIPNVMAANDYDIRKYVVNIVVHEDNRLDITEKITANFNVAKHGIIRKIPLKNNIQRLDGTTSNNKAVITNINVSDHYTKSRENGYLSLKIGDANKTLKGEHVYLIQYTYDLGKDPLKNQDEFYFNIIGTEWDTNISNVEFHITMPKEFDSKLLGFSSGRYGSVSNNLIKYNVNGNVITGTYNGVLKSGEGLTIRLTLPDGYFVHHFKLDYRVLVPIVLFLMSFVVWWRFGKNKKIIETVEFYPPENCNSLVVGFLYKGYANNKDVISLLIYLANLGYIKIVETKEKIFSSDRYKFIKLKEYDGESPTERTFMRGFFGNLKEEVTIKQLKNSFYSVINHIKADMNSKENKNDLFDQEAKKKGIFIILFAIINLVFLFHPLVNASGFSTVFMGIVFVVIGITFVSIMFYNAFKQGSLFLLLFALIWGSLFSGIPFFGILLPVILEDPTYTPVFIVGIFCFICMLLLFMNMKKRSEEGYNLLCKIKGFKKFLKTVEKEKLEAMVLQNPSYFYDILPFTYVLGLSNKWIKNFEDIAQMDANWYESDGVFETSSFNHFINSSLATTVGAAMTSVPAATYSSSGSSSSSSSSSGSSSGGGSSGGGSGGGGGSSW